MSGRLLAFPYPAHPRTPYPPLIVNAALTGMLAQRARVPHVPLDTEAIVADAGRCFDAGARIVHVHARDADGQPVWRREAYAEMIPAIRERCPGVIVCATTSGRAEPDVARRADVLSLEGDARPDTASLTLGSLNFHTGPSVNAIDTIEELALRMADAGVRPELEVFDEGMAHMAHRLLDRGLIQAPLYVNIMLGFAGGAPADARALVALVQALPAGTVWAAAGLGAFQAVAGALAVAMGGHVRTGLEDNPWLDVEGTEPARNVELVTRAVDAGRALGRTVATPQQARTALGLVTAAPSPIEV